MYFISRNSRKPVLAKISTLKVFPDEDTFSTKTRSSLPDVFLGKAILKICSKFTGERSCRSAISIKLQTNFIEITLRHGCFPVNLLHIFTTPFPKNTYGWLLLKDEGVDKENCRPVNILSRASNFFERLTYNQIDNFIASKFSLYLCSFRKYYNSQHSHSKK